MLGGRTRLWKYRFQLILRALFKASRAAAMDRTPVTAWAKAAESSDPPMSPGQGQSGRAGAQRAVR